MPNRALRTSLLLLLLTIPLAFAMAAKDAPPLEPVNLHQVVYHDFPLPDAATLDAREAQARAAAEAHPSVQAVRAGSFSVVAEFEYTPEVSYVDYSSWHRQRIVGPPEAMVVVMEAGWLTRVAVDPATGEVTGVEMAPRAPTAIPRSFGPEQLEAVRIARLDLGVQAELAGWEAFPRLAFWRADFLGLQEECGRGGCAWVFFRQVGGVRELAVTVNLRTDAVIATERINWDQPAPTPPALVATAQALAPHGQARGLDHNPVTKFGWEVTYSTTTDDGLQVDRSRHQDSSGAMHDVIWKSNVPFVSVWYTNCGTGPQDNCFVDPLCDSCAGVVTLHEYTNGFYVHRNFYVFCGPSEWSAAETGCYKYEHRHTFYQNGAYHPWLHVYGPGFHGTSAGSAYYYVPFQLDFDVAGACCDSSSQYGLSGYTVIGTEGSSSHGAPVDANGYKWMVSDANGKSIRVRPTDTLDNAVWWTLVQESDDGERYPSSFDNNQNTLSADLMFYYAARRYDFCTPDARCRTGAEVITSW